MYFHFKQGDKPEVLQRFIPLGDTFLCAQCNTALDPKEIAVVIPGRRLVCKWCKERMMEQEAKLA
jgi:hypothetical protein